MAARYWRGGNAAWDGTAGTKWSLTSGGAGGQAVPTSADDVFFDANSGASTVTISTGNTGAKSITCTGFTGTLTGTAAISVAGSVTLVAGMTFSYTGTLTVTATGTVTSASKTFCPININGLGITVTLADAMTLATTSTFTLTTGTINLAGFTLSTGLFASSFGNSRVIAFGATGKIQLTSAVTSTIWNTSNVTNFSYTGTSSVESIGAGASATKTINTGTMSESQALNWTINETTGATANIITFTTNNAVRDFNVNASNGGRYQITNVAITIYGNYTYNGNYIPGKCSAFFNGTTSSLDGIDIPSQLLNFNTTDWTVEAWIYKTASQQASIFTLANYISGVTEGFNFETNASNQLTQNNGVSATVVAGTISLNTWTHVAAVRSGGTTQLYVGGVAVGATFTQSPLDTQYFKIGCNFVSTFKFFPGYISNIRAVKGVAVYTGNFTPPSLAPLATSGAASAAAYPSTTNVNTSFAASATSVLSCQTAMDMVDNSIYKFNITVTGNTIVSFQNPYISNIFPLINTGGNALTFASTGTQSFNTNNISIDNNIILNNIGGTFLLQSTVNVGASNGIISLNNGTLNLNGNTLNTPSITTGFIAGAKNITFNGGTISLGSSFNGSNSPGFTTTAGTGTGTIKFNKFSGNKYLFGGNSIFNCVIDQSGSGPLIIDGGNTFLDITNSYGATGATTITFTSATTTTVSNFTASGGAGGILTINSTTAGSAATLSSASGVKNASNIRIQDSTATGGAAWYATNSTNVSNNTGWIFNNAAGAFMLFG
jgi:hypothetical protein